MATRQLVGRSRRGVNWAKERQRTPEQAGSSKSPETSRKSSQARVPLSVTGWGETLRTHGLPSDWSHGATFWGRPTGNPLALPLGQLTNRNSTLRSSSPFPSVHFLVFLFFPPIPSSQIWAPRICNQKSPASRQYPWLHYAR